jgi:hypothetical protein
VCSDPCVLDSECGEGRSCGLDGRCRDLACSIEGTCIKGYTCVDGTCVRDSCNVDADCGTDRYCVIGKCYDKPGSCRGN